MNSQYTDENDDTNNHSDNENSIWLRVLYMLLFAIVFGICETVLYLVAIVNLVIVIINKRAHGGLKKFGNSLAIYMSKIAQYLTFNTEQLPFPFDKWPATNESV